MNELWPSKSPRVRLPKSEFRDSSGVERSPFVCQALYYFDIIFGVFPVRMMHFLRWCFFAPMTVIAMFGLQFELLVINTLALWASCVLFRHWDIIELAAVSRPSGWSVRSSRKIVAKRLGWIALVSNVTSFSLMKMALPLYGSRYAGVLWLYCFFAPFIAGPGIVCIRHLVLMYIDVLRDRAGLTFYFDYQEEEPDPE